jgi:hypothetical protein
MLHTPARASASGAAPLTWEPAMWTHPSVGTMRPLITLSVVVLPPPFGPSRAKTVPGGTVKLIPCTTSMRP